MKKIALALTLIVSISSANWPNSDKELLKASCMYKEKSTTFCNCIVSEFEKRTNSYMDLLSKKESEVKLITANVTNICNNKK